MNSDVYCGWEMERKSIKEEQNPCNHCNPSKTPLPKKNYRKKKEEEGLEL